MTISSEVRKAGPFTGNGVTTSFPFTFKVFQASEVLVVSADLDTVEETLTMGTDYTVSLNADQNISPGGSVVLSDPLTTDFKLVITSRVQNLQPVDLTNSGGFYPDVINKALDRATIQIQQLEEKSSRAVLATLTSDADTSTLYEDLMLASAAAVEAADRIDLGALDAAVAAAEASAVTANTVAMVENMIINGNFSVNQAALTSPVTLSAGARAHSCWKAGPFGATYSWTTTGGVTTLNITAGSIIQVIEGTDLASGPHTASWSGTAVGRFDSEAYAAAGIATKTLTAGTNASLELSAGTVSLVSMAAGSVARPSFRRRLAEERALCEYRLPSIIANGASNLASGTIISTGVGYVFINLKETPRAHPTGLLLVGGAVGTLTVTSGVTSAALTGLTFLSANDTRIAMSITWSGGPSSVGAAIYVNTSATPTRLLFTGAEL